MTVTALTPAQRKRAQRERDRAALWALGVSLDTLTTVALLEALPGLLAGERPGTARWAPCGSSWAGAAGCL